jgi:lipoprotein-anchoring transpeptidase ErfK/SrfK
MRRSARAGVRGAPVARAAVAAALVAVAATVLVGLGHADEEQGAGSDLMTALPAATSTRPAPAQTPPARPAEEASTSDEDADHDADRERSPGRVRAAAPLPASSESTASSASSESSDASDASDSSASTARPASAAAPPPSSTAPRPDERAAASASMPQANPVGGGDPPGLVAGTPCTATARACVNLDQRLAWLIDAGRVVRGPVPIQHGDAADPTPKGTFEVQWKAEQYTSREYLTQMPYSVFFAQGGIAFHEGAQSTPSAGCVKLGHEDAKAWFAYLQVGDEVQIH